MLVIHATRSCTLTNLTMTEPQHDQLLKSKDIPLGDCPIADYHRSRIKVDVLNPFRCTKSSL